MLLLTFLFPYCKEKCDFQWILLSKHSCFFQLKPSLWIVHKHWERKHFLVIFVEMMITWIAYTWLYIIQVKKIYDWLLTEIQTRSGCEDGILVKVVFSFPPSFPQKHCVVVCTVACRASSCQNDESVTVYHLVVTTHHDLDFGCIPHLPGVGRIVPAPPSQLVHAKNCVLEVGLSHVGP